MTVIQMAFKPNVQASGEFGWANGLMGTELEGRKDLLI